MLAVYAVPHSQKGRNTHYYPPTSSLLEHSKVFFFFSLLLSFMSFISLNQHLLTGNGSHNASGFLILWVGVAVHTEPSSISKSVTTIIYSWEYLGKPKILESVVGEKPWVRIWDTFFQDTALRGEPLSSYPPSCGIQGTTLSSHLSVSFLLK